MRWIFEIIINPWFRLDVFFSMRKALSVGASNRTLSEIQGLGINNTSIFRIEQALFDLTMTFTLHAFPVFAFFFSGRIIGPVGRLGNQIQNAALPWFAAFFGPSFIKDSTASGGPIRRSFQIWRVSVVMAHVARMKIEGLMKGKKLPFDDQVLDTWLVVMSGM